MKRFLIQNFLFVSIVLFISGCSLRFHSNLSKNTEKEVAEYNVLGKNFEKVLYKTNIEVYKKPFSGLLFIKEMPKDSSYRIVFLSEVGLKIFDFEYLYGNNREEDFKVHYILEPLNKRILVKTLRYDFELLLMNNIDKENFKSYKSKEGKHRVRRYKNRKGRYYYYKDKDSGNIEKIEKCGMIFKKVEANIDKYDNNSPKKVKFTHKNLNLKIELNQVKQ